MTCMQRFSQIIKHEGIYVFSIKLVWPNSKLFYKGFSSLLYNIHVEHYGKSEQ